MSSNKKRDLKAKAKAVAAVTKSVVTTTSPKNLKMVSTSVTGGVFVDHFVPKADQYSVLKDAAGKALSCYLMWCDVKENHNKFYVA